jgi:hypothetical protein
MNVTIIHIEGGELPSMRPHVTTSKCFWRLSKAPELSLFRYIELIRVVTISLRINLDKSGNLGH